MVHISNSNLVLEIEIKFLISKISKEEIEVRLLQLKTDLRIKPGSIFCLSMAKWKFGS